MAGGFADRVERRHTAGGSRAAGRHTGSIWLADGRIKAVLANATRCDFALTVRDADRPTASLRLRSENRLKPTLEGRVTDAAFDVILKLSESCADDVP
jgi:hypothetical protein